MTLRVLTEHHLEFLSLEKEAAQARLSLHLSKCHIVGNHMSRLICCLKKKFTDTRHYYAAWRGMEGGYRCVDDAPASTC